MVRLVNNNAKKPRFVKESNMWEVTEFQGKVQAVNWFTSKKKAVDYYHKLSQNA